MINPSADQQLLSRNGSLPPITPRVLIFHTAVDGTNTQTLRHVFERSTLASHFYVSRDGQLQQYVDTDRAAAAQFDANAFAISVETWDGSATTGVIPRWSDAQVAAINDLARWCNRVHAIPLTQVQTWDGSGIGWHSQFGRWAKDGHTCPTDVRIAQLRDEIIPRLAEPQAPEVHKVIALARNADGRLEEFRVVGGALSHRWQTAPGQGWSRWDPLGSPDHRTLTDVTAAANADGRLEVLCIAADGTSWRRWQQAANQAFSGWSPA